MRKDKRIVGMIMAGLLAGAVITGCGNNAQEPAQTEPETTEDAAVEETAEAETAEAESADAQVDETEAANPWKECTEEEAKAACPRLFKAPEDAVVNGWMMMEPENSENGIPGPLVEMDFRMEGVDFCARAQYGTDENEDISGMNYEWTATDDATLANWGEGNMPAKHYRNMEDDWTVDLMTWYDIEIGITYSLSAEAADLDGFDIQAIAEQMYDGANDLEMTK